MEDCHFSFSLFLIVLALFGLHISTHYFSPNESEIREEVRFRREKGGSARLTLIVESTNEFRIENA